MKEHYETLSEFLDDILKMAEDASKEIKNTQEINKEKVKDAPKQCDEKERFKYNGPLVNKKPDNMINVNCKDSACLKKMPQIVDIVDDNCYLLTNMIKGDPIAQHQELIFEHTTEGGYIVPGITVGQLLTILYNKFKNNPKKLSLVKELMN